MHYTAEAKYGYNVSLLQDDVYDWWETIQNMMIYDGFLQAFYANYMPIAY